MQQEIGGNYDKYLTDPTQYHYAAGPDGRRIAPHTGQVSTAFGPFGILESTAAKPGYGVRPLASKDLAEQIRFASDYLAGRIKQAGSIEAGLAGYGEGRKYASSVMGRLGQPIPVRAPTQEAAPVVVAQPGRTVDTSAVPPPVLPMQPDESRVVPMLAEIGNRAAPPVLDGRDPWQEFLLASQAAQSPAQSKRVLPSDLDFASKAAVPAPVLTVADMQTNPNFNLFQGWDTRI